MLTWSPVRSLALAALSTCFAGCLHQVLVHAPCQVRAGVAEGHLHDFDRHASGEHQRACSLTCVVQSDDRLPTYLHMVFKRGRRAVWR